MKFHHFFASVFTIISLSVSAAQGEPPTTSKRSGATHRPHFLMHGTASIDSQLGLSNAQGIGDVRVRLVGELGDECLTKVQIKKVGLFYEWSVAKNVTSTGALFLDRDPGSYRLRFTTGNSACTPPEKFDFTVIADREVRVNVKYVSVRKKKS